MSTSRTSAVLWSDRSASVIASLMPAASSMLAIPILARTLSREEFGVWALIMTAVATLQLLDFGISASVMRFATVAAAGGDLAQAWKYWWTSCLAYLAMTTPFAFAVVVLPADEFISHRTSDDAGLVLALTIASVFLAPASNTLIILLRALGRYRFSVVAIAVGQVFFVGTLLLGLAADDLSLWTVLVAQAMQFGAVIAAVLVSSPGRGVPRFLPFESLPGLLSFGSRMMLVNLINAGMMFGPLWVTSSILSPTAAGKFAFASTIAVAVRNLPLMSVSPIFNRLAHAAGEVWSIGDAQHAQWRLSVLVYLGLAIPGAVLLTPVIGGARFGDAALLACVLIVGYGFGLMTAVLSQLLRVTNHASSELAAWVWGGAVEGVLLVPAVMLFGGMGAACAVVCGQATACVAMQAYVLRVRDRS